MLSDEKSLLRNLPRGLDYRQTLFLDAIRISLDSIDEAYNLLQANLRSLEASGGAEQRSVPASAGTLVAMYAWSVVDWMHRLRVLLDQAPRLQARRASPDFMSALEEVEEFRHGIQHVNREIARSAATRRPISAIGALAWGRIADDARSGVDYFIQLGTAVQAEHPMSLVVDQEEGRIIGGGPYLYAYGRTLDIGAQHRQVVLYAEQLQSSLEVPPELAEAERLPSESLVGIRIQLTDRRGR